MGVSNSREQNEGVCLYKRSFEFLDGSRYVFEQSSMVYCNETSDGAMYINFGVTIGNEDGSSRSVEHRAKVFLNFGGVEIGLNLKGGDDVLAKE